MRVGGVSMDHPEAMTARLYGIAEIAAALGVPRNTVAQWLKRGKLPQPDAELAMGPVWSGRRIERWIEKQRRA
jgi:predicted DNA-binding transcriptional regulator AlpA